MTLDKKAPASGTVLDPFARYRSVTRARIGLGRVGDGLPTDALLDFQLAHSCARDAVHGAVDFDALAEAIAPLPAVRIRSCAKDRTEYLRRPDLGRRVHADDAAALMALRAPDGFDLALVIADGLSASAITAHAAPLLAELTAHLPHTRLAPIVLAEQARVALGDEVGSLLGARMVVVLIGERPGLSVADSLGIYLTWQPRVGRLDSERNCISNVHAHGLSYEQARSALVWLLHEARRLGQSGVLLKAEPAREAVLAEGASDQT